MHALLIDGNDLDLATIDSLDRVVGGQNIDVDDGLG